MLGDSVTTDHISPAGSIPKNGPAARYLREHGVEQVDWNTFGSRRGNHEVMMRGTFGNVRISNALVPDKEGNWTLHFPSGEVVSIYDAAMRYQAEGTPLVILTGKEYGTGSSRDWAAKGPALLGVKAVIAESYERIHRSNLVGMGVLPLAYEPGTDRKTLGLTGRETFSISGIAKGLTPGGRVTVTARDESRQGDRVPRGRAAQLRGGAGLLSPRRHSAAGAPAVHGEIGGGSAAAKLLHGRESPRRRLGQRPADDLIDRRRHVGAQPPDRGNGRAEYPGRHLRERPSGVRRPACQHLVQDAPQAVDIRPLVEVTRLPGAAPGSCSRGCPR